MRSCEQQSSAQVDFTFYFVNQNFLPMWNATEQILRAIKVRCKQSAENLITPEHDFVNNKIAVFSVLRIWIFYTSEVECRVNNSAVQMSAVF